MIVPKGGNFIVLKEDELAHHGVLGQKWGIRRYQNKDGSRTSEGKRRERIKKTEEQKASEYQKKKDVINRGTLTTEELKEKVERLRLEKEMVNLTREDLAPGRTYLKNASQNAGKLLLQTAATAATTAAVGYAMKNLLDGGGASRMAKSASSLAKSAASSIASLKPTKYVTLSR